jgi:hypothetical protein
LLDQITQHKTKHGARGLRVLKVRLQRRVVAATTSAADLTTAGQSMARDHFGAVNLDLTAGIGRERFMLSDRRCRKWR